MPQPRGTRLRSTRQAAAVIAVMSGMAAFSDARDIHEAVREAGGRVGLATVYRHLRVLAEQGSVDAVRGPGGQALYRLRRDGCTHHLTCRICGRAVEVDGREIWEWAGQVASLAGFTLTEQAVELTGVCRLHASNDQEAQDTVNLSADDSHQVTGSSGPGRGWAGAAPTGAGPGRGLVFSGVPDGVEHDVGDVLVGQRVLDLAGSPPCGHDAAGTQYAQVLGDQRLADTECGDQLVHGPVLGGQLAHDSQPDRRGERPQQFAGGLKRRIGLA
jgi:Fur family ferric uptake transcriptional regulator